ncbi:stage II sporulation protein M [Thermaerobacter sp. PB12/4term]|uniref:stage II sporulation protein M n=1 Tax=Thermaerobacter sp. PB12/4term TaxID=2293838 RepID=UPI000E3292B8|nr:stage II sporulation protein M [Thermaerobacter sp. PB12/4term]QIA27086.1 stage II sporulation protein M [Thermaerobacter sp. PB12/4term]
MLQYLPRALALTLRQHQAALVLAALILVVGIVTGALHVAQLDPGQQAQVGQYLDYLLATAAAGSADAGSGAGAAPDPAGPGGGSPTAGAWPGSSLPWQAAGSNLRQVVLAWGAGCLVLGLPVTLGMLFLHGYSLGFAVGALAAHWQWRGLVIALAGIFPPNLLQVPALLVVAAAATRLAAQVAASRWRRALPALDSPWSPYVALGLVAVVLATGSGLVEAYLAPRLLALAQRLAF